MATRVLFFQAPLGRPEPLIYPLGIATLAGTLSPRYTVKIIDPNHIGIEASKKQIRNFCPDVICLSIRNIDSQIRRDLFYYYLYLKKIISELREWSPRSILVAGGAGFSLFPQKIMEDNAALDAGVFLEADITLPQLLENLNNPSEVRGVFHRVQNRVAFTGNPELPNPEAFGRPRYDLLNPVPYAADGGIGVQTKRGCPLNCIYCTYPHLNGTTLRLIPLNVVLNEIHTLRHQYGIDNITFVDGIFNIPRLRTEQLVQRMAHANPGLRWRAWFTEQGFDRAFAGLCRDCGCPEFSFSPDGFSDETMKKLGKTTRKEDIDRLFAIARETPGIRVAFNFFWNPPGQTFATWMRMMMFAIKCKCILRKKAGGIIFGNPRIEPCTPLMELALQNGVLAEDTDLLPDNANDLKKTFYSNPSTRYLDTLYSIYEFAWNVKKRIKRS